MLARLLKKTDPFNFILMVFFLFIYGVLRFFFIHKSFFSTATLLEFTGVFFLFSFLVFLGDFIVKKNNLTERNSYFLFFFVLLAGFFSKVLDLHEISFSHLFILLSTRRFYSLYRSKHKASKLFDSGLYIGFAFLLYPPTILYLILVYIAYFIFEKVINKQLFIPVIGFITPVFIRFAYDYYNGNSFMDISGFQTDWGFDLVQIMDNRFFTIPFYLMVFLAFASMILHFFHRQAQGNRKKGLYYILVVHLIISLIVVLMYKSSLEKSIQFVFFPVAVLLAKSFEKISKRMIREIIAYVLFLITLILLIIH